jgi:hypothetical protein
MGIAQLLEDTVLQQELGLSDTQKANLRDALGEIRRKLMTEADAALDTILTRDQLERFKQIGNPPRGFTALGNPDIQSQLRLTGDQRRQIRAILKDSFKEATALRKSLTLLRWETKEKAMAVLSENQKSIWEEIRASQLELNSETDPGANQESGSSE